jgi:hypothetical protein
MIQVILFINLILSFFQMAQAASALMPLTVLQAATALTGTRRAPTNPVVGAAVAAGGPIHHQPQLGRFRYSPLGTTALASNAGPTLTAGGLVGGMPADLLTTSALLQMQMASQTAQQQLAALQAAAASNPAASVLANAPTVGSPGRE